VLQPRIERPLDGAMSFTEEMQRRGLDPQTRLLVARPEAASEIVAAALDVEPGSPSLYLERLRLANGTPLLLEMVHLPAERFPGLLASDLEHNSLHEILTTRYGTPDTRVREAPEPVHPSARDPRLLDLPPPALAPLVASACSGQPSGSVQPTPRNAFNPATLPPVAQQTFHIPEFSPAALRWYCCLGTGEDAAQLPTEKDAAAGFATKYPGSSLKLEI